MQAIIYCFKIAKSEARVLITALGDLMSSGLNGQLQSHMLKDTQTYTTLLSHTHKSLKKKKNRYYLYSFLTMGNLSGYQIDTVPNPTLWIKVTDCFKSSMT